MFCISDTPKRSLQMHAFSLIWFGQLISQIGTNLTGFALGILVYQHTGSVTQLTLIYLFTAMPGIIVSPLAGALVDRWDRRWVMILCDAGASLGTLSIGLLLFVNRFEIWYVYLAVSVNSIFNSFHWLAYYASTTLLVPKRHVGRANGMVQFKQVAAQIISPMLSGMLIATIKVQGVILIDFVTFLFALFTLMIVHIPKSETTAKGKAGKESLLREAAFGMTYITSRPGLLWLLIFFAAINFQTGIISVLATPLVLSFSSATALGTVLSIGGSGMLIGSLVMSMWGGPKRRIYGILGFTLLSGMCMILAGLHPSIKLITIASFIFFFSLSIINSSSQTIWQNKVAPHIQGRVFAVRRMAALVSLPLAYLAAGPLADHVFEPLLTSDGLLAGSIGHLIGVGSGRGIGLLFIIMGILTVIGTTGGCLCPHLRNVEDDLPDMIADELPINAENKKARAAVM